VPDSLPAPGKASLEAQREHEMNTEAWILIGVVAFAIAAFVREWMPMDVVALTSLALCLVFDLVSPEEAISGFGNPAVITVLMMFILSSFSCTRVW
jgi:di/tricarboxylate transporter